MAIRGLLAVARRTRKSPSVDSLLRRPLARSSASAPILGGQGAVRSSFANGSSRVPACRMDRGQSPGHLKDVFLGSVVARSSLSSALKMKCTTMCFQPHDQRLFSTNADLPPHQELGMPSLSPTMTEGNIARWLKKEGDKVSPGEVLCEVETDKATVEMECMEEGYIAKIIHGDGAKEIKVGEAIAITVENEEDIGKFKDYKVSASPGSGGESAAPQPPPKKEEMEPVKAPEPEVPKTDSQSRAEDRVFSSPLARKLAEDHNVPLSSIKGTGPDGRILKADIEDYLARTSKEPSKAVEPTLSSLNYSDIPNSQIRKVIASRLLLSKQTIPHYYLTVDTRVDKLMDLRGELNALQEASGGKRISVNDLVIKVQRLAINMGPCVGPDEDLMKLVKYKKMSDSGYEIIFWISKSLKVFILQKGRIKLLCRKDSGGTSPTIT